MKYLPSILLLLFFSLPLSATAADTATCHCFQDRQYNPENPSAADAYLLATTQNSLLSVAFSVSKREIVQKKMQGADGDLLWVVYYLSAEKSVPVNVVANLWDKQQNWQLVIAALNRVADSTFAGGAYPPEQLRTTQSFADAIVHRFLYERLGIAPSAITQLRASGATRKDLLLAVLISARVDRSLQTVWEAVKQQRGSWGSQLFAAQIEPKKIAEEWQRRLDRYREANRAEH